MTGTFIEEMHDESNELAKTQRVGDYNQTIISKRDQLDDNTTFQATSAQSYQIADFKSELTSRANFTDDELARLKELRLKELEYSDEELEFMYKMHLQTEYRRENLQNPKSLDQLQENDKGESPGEYTKWTLSRLT